jgi:hypothetical protein
MTSAVRSRADFYGQVCPKSVSKEFRSLSLARNSSNWIGSQKCNSLDRLLAYMNVEQASQNNIIMAAGGLIRMKSSCFFAAPLKKLHHPIPLLVLSIHSSLSWASSIHGSAVVSTKEES